jgi:hypothetical protein
MAFLVVPASAPNAAVWVGAVDQYAQPKNPSGSAFMNLFQDDAAWGAAEQIQFFKLSTQFLHRSTDAELNTVIQALKKRHIAMGMAGLLLVESQRCGRGVESYAGRGAVIALAQRVARLGGNIAAVAMDSPVWYGTRVSGPRNCHDSVDSIAEQMAENVHALKSAFPGVRFGTAEPINGTQTEGHIEDILRFAKAFQYVTGEPLSFVQADITWRSQWEPQLAEWKRKLHANKMQLGVICDGDSVDASDEAWINHATDRYRLVAGNPAIRPDDFVFQSWSTHPTRLVPDSDPQSLTGMVRVLIGQR